MFKLASRPVKLLTLQKYPEAWRKERSRHICLTLLQQRPPSRYVIVIVTFALGLIFNHPRQYHREYIKRRCIQPVRVCYPACLDLSDTSRFLDSYSRMLCIRIRVKSETDVFLKVPATGGRSTSAGQMNMGRPPRHRH